MSGETIITVVGNLTADPEMRYTNSGVPFASFTIASTPRTFDKQSNEWKDGEALFLRCTVWREYAQNVADSLTKGARVIVQGNLTQRSYETKQGEKRTSYELDVVEVGPALKYSTAQVTKAASSSKQGGFGGGSQPQWASAPPAQENGPQGGFSQPAGNGFGNDFGAEPF